MTPTRHRPLVAAALTAATLVVGCQSDGGGGMAPLSLSRLTGTADDMPAKGSDTCPLPYDMAKAAKTAGLDAPSGPGPVRGDDDPVATAEGGERAEPGEPLAENPGALVSCVFHVGRDDVQVHTIATRERHAIAPLAPLIQTLSGVSTDDLISYVKKAGDARAGDVTGAGSGNVAAVRLGLDGDADAFLLVGAGENGTASLDRKQVAGLTEALAAQVR